MVDPSRNTHNSDIHRENMEFPVYIYVCILVYIHINILYITIVHITVGSVIFYICYFKVRVSHHV